MRGTEICNGSMISIDTIVVEGEATDNLYQHSEIDCLAYNDPAVYADLILNGDPEAYLKAVTEDAALSQTRSKTQSYLNITRILVKKLDNLQVM